jgi:purine catabolism regulator
VRWVHVAEARDVASVLRGGELLITEGRPFQGPDSDQRRFVAELAERRIAGVILELGTHFQSVPAELIKAFDEHELALVALHVPVPFIEVTEAINTSIVDSKSALLVQGEAIHRRLTELALGGAGVGEVLEAVAEAVENPVIFEREGGGIAYQARGAHSERDVFAAWERFTHGLPDSPEVIERRLPEVRGELLGRVVALGLSGPLGGSEEAAIDRSLGVIGLTLWYERHEEALAARSNRGFLAALLDGEISPMTANNRAVASGFGAPALLPLAVTRARHHSGRLVAVEDRTWGQVWKETIAELESRRLPAMVDPQPTSLPTLAVVGLAEVNQRAATASRFASLVASIAERHYDEPNPVVVSVGPAVHTWPAAVGALTVAVDAISGAAFARPRPWHDAVDLDLDRLLWSLRENPDLARFAELRVRELVAYDRTRNAQLVATLEAFLEHNGHKAATARALHLERQSLYNRIDRIETLAGIDLGDPDTRLSLHLALRVRASLVAPRS